MTAFSKMMSNPLRRAEILTAYLFLSPTLLGFVVFIVGPVIAAVVLSTYKWNLINPAEAVGLANYQTASQRPTSRRHLPDDFQNRRLDRAAEARCLA